MLARSADRATSIARTTAALAALAALAACGPRPEQRACDQLFAQADACGLLRALPPASIDDARTYCEVSLRDLPAPGQLRDDLGALTAQALDECSRAASCPELAACFDHHRCVATLRDRDDRRPQFTCTPSPHR